MTDEIKWLAEYETGIKIIDNQHKRIISYINKLYSLEGVGDRDAEKEVLNELVEYTLSHFVFEESLMDEAGYPAAATHSKTHDAFEKQIYAFKKRSDDGENISIELGEMLSSWLFGHIKEDDISYVPFVLKNMPAINKSKNNGWIKKKIAEIFA